MTLTTVPLGKLLAPQGNPRRLLDKTQIAGLAQSISINGMLQNLVVRPEGDDTYRVISGKRRYLALHLLKDTRAIDSSYEVPVRIKLDLGDREALQIATVENVQREQLHPLDEGEAFAKLLQSGGSLDVVIEQTGLSVGVVRRRLALASLSPEVKKAFRAGEFNRSIAEALSLAAREQQRGLLESLRSDNAPDAEDIRSIVLGMKPTLAMAIFERDRYHGTLTIDLFSDDENTYFDDIDQFLILQQEAVEMLADERRKTDTFVEVVQLYTVPWWQFREAAEGEPSGTVINLHPSGSVEVRSGLARHQIEAPVREATQASPLQPRPAKARPAFGAELLHYAACQRSAVVQAALLANPRKAREVSATLLLVGYRRDFGVRLRLHACHGVTPEARDQGAYRCIEDVVLPIVDALGLTPEAPADNQRIGPKLLVSDADAFDLYEAVHGLPDEALDRLLTLLPLLSLGQDHPEMVDTGDSLFNRIAGDVGIQLRSWWLPDGVFLGLLTREQLLQVVARIGATEQLKGLNGWTKKRLVEELAAHFANQSEGNNEEHRAAREWLPGLLRFPAIKALIEDTP